MKDALGHGSNDRGGAQPAVKQRMTHASAGARAAFKVRHDMGKDARIAAAHQTGVGQLPTWLGNVGKALLGVALGTAGTFIRAAKPHGHGRH